MPRSIHAEHEGAVVYIVRCADGSYYTGRSMISAEKRVSEHNLGVFEGYTKSRRPVTLIFSERFDRIADAIAFERQVKGWSRAKKEALIRGDWEALRDLAHCRTKGNE
ncbi:MAG: GIY-YIG nuclease family protein [Hyphomonadaceae bacterium]|nr:GIY-YIG nuclease family protein [Hyphomonadaceae bacterium]